MEAQHFWAFFVIALIAGGAIALAINNATITGHQIRGIFDIFTRAPAQQPSIPCNDSDGGVDLEVQGICIDADGQHIDVCTSSTWVKEYYCGPGNKCYSNTYGCPYHDRYGHTLSEGFSEYVGCQNGKCVREFTPTGCENCICVDKATLIELIGIKIYYKGDASLTPFERSCFDLTVKEAGGDSYSCIRCIIDCGLAGTPWPEECDCPGCYITPKAWSPFD